MENLHTGHRFVPLDPTSEILLAWERDGFPQTAWSAFSFKGSCDVTALQTALQNKLSLRPVFQSHLVARTRTFLQTYQWRIADDPCPLEVTDLRDTEKRPDDMEQWLEQRLAPTLKRNWRDLATAYPVRFILLLLPENYGFFVIVWHHAAIDGGGLYDFLRDLFSEYHRLVKGKDPEWARVAGLHAQAGNIEEVRPPRWGSFFKEAITQMIKYPPHDPAQVISSPSASSGRNMIRHYIDDPVLQKALRERARRDGGTFSDLCLAAAKLALQEWNEGRGKPPRVMHHWLAVNQRLRQARTQTSMQSNPLIAVDIPSLPADRKDPQALLRHVINRRVRMLDGGFDVALHRVANGIMRAGRIMPISIRYPAVRLIMDHKLSFFLSNLGVVWPRIENGKPTGETAVRYVGDMELVDVLSSIGATFNNPIGLILRTFQGRLCFTFTIGRHRISDGDAQAFTRLVVDKVMRYLS